MVEKGISREEAYRIVQRNAHAAFDDQILFDDKIKEDKEIISLFTKDELNNLISFDQYTNNIDLIYERVYS